MKRPKRKGPKFRVGQAVKPRANQNKIYEICEVRFNGLDDGEFWYWVNGEDIWFNESQLRPLNAKEVGRGWVRKEQK